MSEVGRTIYRVVREQPGIHFRALGRAAGLTSAGQLRHHLDRLERQGLLVELEDGRYKRFFVAGDHDRTLRPGLARFARLVPRKIGKLLLVHPMNRTELRRSLGCADSTLGYHLKRMMEQGDLEKQRGRNCCKYSLTRPDLVQKVLMLQSAEPNALSGGLDAPSWVQEPSNSEASPESGAGMPFPSPFGFPLAPMAPNLVPRVASNLPDPEPNPEPGPQPEPDEPPKPEPFPPIEVRAENEMPGPAGEPKARPDAELESPIDESAEQDGGFQKVQKP